MADKQNESTGSQGASGPGQYGDGTQTEPGAGEGQRSGQQQQYIELPAHQGVIIDYIPPAGGMRSEVGDIDAGGGDGDIESPEAGDEALPGHMGGGLAGA